MIALDDINIELIACCIEESSYTISSTSFNELTIILHSLGYLSKNDYYSWAIPKKYINDIAKLLMDLGFIDGYKDQSILFSWLYAAPYQPLYTTSKVSYMG